MLVVKEQGKSNPLIDKEERILGNDNTCDQSHNKDEQVFKLLCMLPLHLPKIAFELSFASNFLLLHDILKHLFLEWDVALCLNLSMKTETSTEIWTSPE